MPLATKLVEAIMRQTTLHHPVSCSGIGLHSGQPVGVTLRPAIANTGLVFRLHTAQGPRRLAPTPYAVMTTALATTLGRDEARVSTVEHLLAAVRGLGLDNVIVEVEGEEIPILDGSAALFLDLIQEAGIRRLAEPRKVLRLTTPVEFGDESKFISATPGSGFYVDYTIEFPHPAIGRQRFTLDLTPETFAQVARARTFGFLKDVEYLRKNGLALGGSLDNAVVIGDEGVLNEEGLRYADEFVRHKVLDFIGDMAMLPLPLEGRFKIFCSGHHLNNEFLRKVDREGLLQTVAYEDRVHTSAPAYKGQRLALA